MTTPVGLAGHAPSVTIANPEQRKYQQVWQHQQYREVSPGELWARAFLQQARPAAGAEAIDFGCGTGRGALMLALLGGMKVQMLDFAENCLDAEVAQACKTQPHALAFRQHDLTQAVPANAKYGYCCDVMEHIPPEAVQQVLRNILAAAQHVFFGISTVPDQLGALIGEQLHLTVQPMAWRVDQIRAAGGTVHWTKDMGEACAIYCSAWHDADEIVKVGGINETQETIDQNIRSNVSCGWQHVVPHDTNDREVVLLCGGPSMLEMVDTIRALRRAGCAVVTVNGAYQWAIDQGFADDIGAQIVLDARPFNARFTEPVLPACRYLIASQAHPAVLEKLPPQRTLLWHAGLSDAMAAEVFDFAKFYYPVPGGSTVALRAIPLLRMLGFKRMHVFGFDSCVMGDQHHAYAQPENDREATIPVTCGERTFQCTPWMASQASEFRDLVKFLGDEVELAIYGDGLIAHMLATGASFNTKD